MKLTKNLLLAWSLCEPAAIRKAVGVVCGDVCVGFKGYGDYETYCIQFALNKKNLRRLASAILITAVGDNNELFFPFKVTNDTYQGAATRMARGIKVVVNRTAMSTGNFTYSPKRKLKRYAWYPWTLKCNPVLDLPGFGITAMPDERAQMLWDNRQDLRAPYAVWIGGCPSGLMRLARLLLDYANTDVPPEEIDLEIEGGFRGVGPCSYEARFKRVDDLSDR
jgi:hypothetical protein